MFTVSSIMLPTGNIKDLPTEELEKEVWELEDAYADALSDDADPAALTLIWNRIKALKAELELRTKA